MHKSLFRIQSEHVEALQELEDWLIANDSDEVPREFSERLFINQNEFADKARDYHLAMKMLNAESVYLSEEVARLNHLIARKEKTIDTLKEYLNRAVLQYGTPTKTGSVQFKTPFVNMTFVHTKPIEIVDVSMLPTEYVKAKISATLTQPDYEFLIKTLDEIGVVDNELSDNDTLLRIKEAIKVTMEANKTSIKKTLQQPDAFVMGAFIDEKAGYIRFSDNKNYTDEES